MKSFLEIIFTWLMKDGSRKRIAETVYLALWVIALAGAIYSYYTLNRNDLAGFEGIISWIFGLITACQLYLVYKDLHKIEEDHDAAVKAYGPWINRHLERGIRYAVIFALLFGTGKIGSVIYPMLTCAGTNGTHDSFCEFFEPDGISRHSVFILGSFLAFSFLLAWNIGALCVLHHISKKEDTIAAKVHWDFNFMRTIIFSFTIIMCIGYWALVLERPDFLKEYAPTFILIYVLGFALVVLARWKRVEDKLKKHLIALRESAPQPS